MHSSVWLDSMASLLPTQQATAASSRQTPCVRGLSTPRTPPSCLKQGRVAPQQHPCSLAARPCSRRAHRIARHGAVAVAAGMDADLELPPGFKALESDPSVTGGLSASEEEDSMRFAVAMAQVGAARGGTRRQRRRLRLQGHSPGGSAWRLHTCNKAQWHSSFTD